MFFEIILSLLEYTMLYKNSALNQLYECRILHAINGKGCLFFDVVLWRNPIVSLRRKAPT